MGIIYNFSKIRKPLHEINKLFPQAFINLRGELIIDKKYNIYFRLDNIKNKIEFDCKMIEYLSRPSIKGTSKIFQKYIREKLNIYFNKNWSIQDLELIYTKLGNQVHRKLTMKFIRSKFNLNVLLTN